MHYSYYPYPAPCREDPVLIRNLKKAINGEFSAVQCCRKLAELARRDEIRKQIEDIRRAEMRHLREFSTLYEAITGQHIMPKQTGESPDNFTRGLNAAFIDEQETVHFYLRAAEETSNIKAKGLFTRAARDEQHHAVWFLYYLTERYIYPACFFK
ncbi:ferritin family protein [Bacillus cabrialesii]